MLDAVQILRLLVGLKESGDLDVISKEETLSRICELSNQTKISRMSLIIGRLLDEFDYESTPEFLDTIAGKTEQFHLMKRRLLTPEKRLIQVQRFGQTLIQIIDSNAAFNLVPADRQFELDELRNIALSIVD